jgi:hypothetical protein
MSFNIIREGEYFIVSSSHPVLYPNLDLGRKTIVTTFQDNSATFEEPEWIEDKFPCKEREGYWNHLKFRQIGKYCGRKLGLFGSTLGLKEIFCGPRDIGDIIMNEAAIRQGCYGGGNPYFIEGRKAEQTDKGSITIAFLLPYQVSQNVKLEELFEQEVTHSDEIISLLSA